MATGCDSYGIAGSYEPIDVAPEDFRRASRPRLRESGFAGGNVTIPHKEAAFAAVAPPRRGSRHDRRRQHALARGRRTGRRQHRCAMALPPISMTTRPAGTQAGPAVVLGAGGAARAVIHALQAAWLQPISGSSTAPLARAVELADRFGAGITAHGLDAAAGTARGCRPAGQHHVARHAWQRAAARRPRRICRTTPSSPTSSMCRSKTPLAGRRAAARPEDRRWSRHAAAPGRARFRTLVRRQAGGDAGTCARSSSPTWSATHDRPRPHRLDRHGQVDDGQDVRRGRRAGP